MTAAASVEQHTDSAMVAVRPSVADVLSVTATPSAISAGTPVSVSAQALQYRQRHPERAGAGRNSR